MTTTDFDAAFRRLSMEGKCDSPGGAEWHRVREEWIDAGRPADLDGFIVRRANLRPDGAEVYP